LLKYGTPGRIRGEVKPQHWSESHKRRYEIDRKIFRPLAGSDKLASRVAFSKLKVCQTFCLRSYFELSAPLLGDARDPVEPLDSAMLLHLT
jgi:hypothetical protein